MTYTTFRGHGSSGGQAKQLAFKFNVKDRCTPYLSNDVQDDVVSRIDNCLWGHLN